MMESFFPISNYFMQEKNIENTQFLTLSIHTFPIMNLDKFFHHLDHPIDIKNYYILFPAEYYLFLWTVQNSKKNSHRHLC